MKGTLRLALLLVACCALVASERQSRPLPQGLRGWRIAFVRDGSIWACNGDGSEQQLLIQNANSPSWSPERSRLAFARDGDIWVAAADGTGQRPITTHWAGRTTTDEVASGAGISWHPGGGSLTFSHQDVFKVERATGIAGIVPTRNVVGGSIVGHSIFDVRVTGSEPGQVTVRYDLLDNGTSFSFVHNAHPAWSPSGKKLAFTRNGDVWIVAANKEPEGEPPSDWATTRVAAVASFDEPLHRASRDNRGATRLSWHPDERRLVYGFDRLQGSGFNEIHLLDTVTGRDTVVVRDGLDPCVSLDGRFILYRAYGNVCGADGSCICAVTLDGKGRVRLFARAAQAVW
jgi:hypothetical protein